MSYIIRSIEMADELCLWEMVYHTGTWGSSYFFHAVNYKKPPDLAKFLMIKGISNIYQ
jgi:hypothetical protein